MSDLTASAGLSSMHGSNSGGSNAHKVFTDPAADLILQLSGFSGELSQLPGKRGVKDSRNQEREKPPHAGDLCREDQVN